MLIANRKQCYFQLLYIDYVQMEFAIMLAK